MRISALTWRTETYVDTVGGGLIYSISQFHFHSPDTMINYLSCINPTHKALIRSLQLGVSISRSRKNIPKRVFVTLASLALLRDLKITLEYNDYISKDIFKRIQDNQHWEMIKGLKKFEVYVQCSSLFGIFSEELSFRNMSLAWRIWSLALVIQRQSSALKNLC